VRLSSLACAAVLVMMAPEQAAGVQWRSRTPPAPNPARLLQLGPLEAVGLGIVVCGAVKPMLSSAMRGRELTLKEAYESVAGCVLPLLGPWLIRRYFPEEWNYLPTRVWRVDFGIGSQS